MMKILFQHRPSSFFPLFCIFYIVLSFTGAFAETKMSLKQLKQQDIERALKYERLKNTKLPDPIRRSSPQVLPDVLPVDTDDDGMPDSYESANGLNPNDPDDAWFDPDKDEVVNLFEYQLGSDLNSPATPPIATVASSGADYIDVATAIDAVAPGTCIRIAEGIYRVNYLNFGTKVVMIQGGWKTDFSKRDLKLHSTTFDGGMSDEILYFGSLSSGEIVIILDGLHFVRGKGSFGAVLLNATQNAFMKSSIFNCSITKSKDDFDFGGVLNIINRNTSESDLTIANTMIVGNESSGIYSQITEEATARWRIINTTISNNLNVGGDTGHGVDALAPDTGELTAHIYNSIIRGNTQEDIEIWGQSINFKANHSDIGNVSATFGAVYQPDTGVVNVDPLFVDPTNGDFHLQRTSPVINKGINQGIPLIDFEGEPRVSGTTVDMGADEVAGGGNPLSIRWPLSGTLSDRSVTLRFGGDDPRTFPVLCGGLIKKHTGLDVSAQKEEAVYAAEAGKVREIFYGGAEWEYAVVIEHTDSIPVFTTVYWHVNPLDSLSVGESVITKQKIAIVADLGGNTHFHFGVRKSNHDGISKRGYLPQERGDSDYDDLGDFTGCKTDPLFPEEFIDPEKISYVYGTNPIPDIKANNSAGPITIEPGEQLDVAVSLDPGGYSGTSCDWWLVANTPSGWQSYDLNQGWTSGFSSIHQGGLFNLDSYPVFSISGLDAGAYTYYFAIDLVMDGNLTTNEGQLYYDSVDVKVEVGEISAPTGFTASASGSTVTLNWNVVSGADGYKLYYGYSSGNYAGSVNLGNTTIRVISDVPDGTYYLAIKAYVGSNESGYSDEVSITIESTIVLRIRIDT